MRVVGTLAGILGVLFLGFAPFMLSNAVTDRNLVMILFAALPLVLAVYFLYVSYLVWFKLSPLAVRHICGALGFYSLTLVPKLLGSLRYTGWAAIIYFCCVVGVYLAYRIVTRRLSRLLFPDNAA